MFYYTLDVHAQCLIPAVWLPYRLIKPDLFHSVTTFSATYSSQIVAVQSFPRFADEYWREFVKPGTWHAPNWVQNSYIGLLVVNRIHFIGALQDYALKSYSFGRRQLSWDSGDM